MAQHSGGRFSGARGVGMVARRRGMNGMNEKLRAFQELNQPVMVWSKVEMD